MNQQAILQLRGLTKSFGQLTAVDHVDLDVAEGEFFTIVGPSGCGKTTMLRMLAGMETPTSGDILLRGQRINDMPANQRPTCMVFQSLALFPHRTVGQNIEFPLKIRGVDSGGAQGTGAAADAAVAPAGGLLRQAGHPLFRRRAATRRAGPRPCLRSADPVFRRASVGHRLQTAQDSGEGTQGHPPRDRQDLRLHHPQPGRGDGDERPHRRDARRPSGAGRLAGTNLYPAPGQVRLRVHGRSECLRCPPAG